MALLYSYSIFHKTQAEKIIPRRINVHRTKLQPFIRIKETLLCPSSFSVEKKPLTPFQEGAYGKEIFEGGSIRYRSKVLYKKNRN